MPTLGRTLIIPLPLLTAPAWAAESRITVSFREAGLVTVIKVLARPEGHGSDESWRMFVLGVVGEEALETLGRPADSLPQSGSQGAEAP